MQNKKIAKWRKFHIIILGSILLSIPLALLSLFIFRDPEESLIAISPYLIIAFLSLAVILRIYLRIPLARRLWLLKRRQLEAMNRNFDDLADYLALPLECKACYFRCDDIFELVSHLESHLKSKKK